MILDTSKVSLANGESQPAIDLFPGREVLSYNQSRMGRAVVREKTVGAGNDVIGLVLSSGQRLCGTRNQTVAVMRNKTVRFTEMADVKIGDVLRGERAGVPIIVKVVGLLFFPRREVRLVQFEMDKGKAFIAEGVICR